MIMKGEEDRLFAPGWVWAWAARGLHTLASFFWLLLSFCFSSSSYSPSPPPFLTTTTRMTVFLPSAREGRTDDLHLFRCGLPRCCDACTYYIPWVTFCVMRWDELKWCGLGCRLSGKGGWVAGWLLVIVLVLFGTCLDNLAESSLVV